MLKSDSDVKRRFFGSTSRLFRKRRSNHIFDLEWYTAQYPDSRGYRDAFAHYAEVGFLLGNNPSPLFSTSWYLTNNALMLERGDDPVTDYMVNWRSRQTSPHPLFDSDWYLEEYPDIARRGSNPLSHYLRWGFKEGRKPHPLFDTAWYLQQHPDVRSSGWEPLSHYLNWGDAEGRDPNPLFSVDWYRRKYLSSSATSENALAHYVTIGFKAGHAPNPLFDPAYFFRNAPELFKIAEPLQRYLADPLSSDSSHPLLDLDYYKKTLPASVTASLTNPLVHYLTDGRREGRPNPYFDNAWYLARYPDVDSAGMHPLLHYLLYGAAEGRDPTANFNTQLYLKQHPECAQLDINPLTHFIASGGTENGRYTEVGADRIKRLQESFMTYRLNAFLSSDGYIALATSSSPELSIVLVTYNKDHFSFNCLESIQLALVEHPLSCEVIVFDNGSTDKTRELLPRVKGIRPILSDRNVGFLEGVNRSLPECRGKFTLLLNNDTQLAPGALAVGLDLLKSDDRIGAVGARLVLPDGTLQEAGSIVWSDGACLGYCRGADPETYQAMFRRDVDFCSGAFLLTRTAAFDCFDKAYAPAYYEDVDYCMRLKDKGLRVVYDPRILVFHFEFGSAASKARAIAFQARNQVTFRRKHEDSLKRHLTNAPQHLLLARSADRSKVRLLLIDDRVPHSWLGSGLPRSREIIRSLLLLGVFVTFFPTDEKETDWEEIWKALSPEVEVAFGHKRSDLSHFLQSRKGYYDGIMVSRPHNMEPIHKMLARDRDALGSLLIYDAEALFTDREVSKRVLRGEIVTPAESTKMLKEEVDLAKYSDIICAVSPRDAKSLEKAGIENVAVLGHAIRTIEPQTPFAARAGFLFVGPVHSDDTPNADSLLWFQSEVIPVLQRERPNEFTFKAVGINKSESVREQCPDITFLGRIDDLEAIYAESRVFIAPTRYSAGVPLKIYEAAARGLPAVATPLLVEQLGWHDRREIVCGGTAEEFAAACIELYENEDLWVTIQKNALEAVRRDCGDEAFTGKIAALVAMVRTKRRNDTRIL